MLQIRIKKIATKSDNISVFSFVSMNKKVPIQHHLDILVVFKTSDKLKCNMLKG